jgi:hypothetical protein
MLLLYIPIFVIVAAVSEASTVPVVRAIHQFVAASLWMHQGVMLIVIPFCLYYLIASIVRKNPQFQFVGELALAILLLLPTYD